MYLLILFFFFNDTSTTEIYTLSLHDALPISRVRLVRIDVNRTRRAVGFLLRVRPLVRPRQLDRKSTRLNSSHGYISYAVFCLKKKRKIRPETRARLSGQLSRYHSSTLSGPLR